MWKGSERQVQEGGWGGVHPPPPFRGAYTLDMRVITYTVVHMPWFSRNKPPSHPEIVALRADLDALKTQLRDLRTDWDHTYERFQRLGATLAQRWKRLVAAEDAARASDDSGGSGHARAEGAHRGDDTPGITNPLALELLRRKS